MMKKLYILMAALVLSLMPAAAQDVSRQESHVVLAVHFDGVKNLQLVLLAVFVHGFHHAHDKEGHGDNDPDRQDGQQDALQNVHQGFGVHEILPF